jgi:hypothetical protein
VKKILKGIRELVVLFLISIVTLPLIAVATLLGGILLVLFVLLYAIARPRGTLEAARDVVRNFSL